jgi:hypothetical protein
MSWSKVGNIRGPQGAPGAQGPPGSADGSASINLTGIADGNLSGHRVVTPQADGTLTYASNDNPAHLHVPLWITSGAVLDGDAADMFAFGLMIEPSWSWTPGAPVYLGTGGQLTQTPPTPPGAAFLAEIGVATTATSLFVDRSPSIKLT